MSINHLEHEIETLELRVRLARDQVALSQAELDVRQGDASRESPDIRGVRQVPERLEVCRQLAG